MSLVQNLKTSSQPLDHLGLVAATIDNLGLVDEIDRLLPLEAKAKTTMGQRVAAMILNGLGFVDDRLYLFPKFLSNNTISLL
jgi:transposase